MVRALFKVGVQFSADIKQKKKKMLYVVMTPNDSE